MKYYSTNQQAPVATLDKAVVKGLAEDKGLYMPERIKPLPKEFFDENGNVVYQFVETTVYNSDENEFYVDNENLSVGEYIYMPDSAEKMPISKSGKLIGVYNMNKGYADFKQITILYQNDEYAIVSSNTKYGLTVYDRIVLDASSVNTDDFVY